jgi:2-polyprenyl-3-methyl-5-hydroxy-6-metoxy-1,4-benzoquinol methylase
MTAPSFAAEGAPAAVYWEERARRYATRGAGLKAVCSYGMPAFHNAAIDLTQRRALAPWLGLPAGSRALDLGCGIGRWSRWLARRGLAVTGVDHAPTMIAEARRRSEAAGLAAACEFRVATLPGLDLGRSFDLVLAVTVLQHILEPEGLESALSAVARHLAPGGRAVLLEAAPSRASGRCDSPVFRARPESEYLAAIGGAGLRVEAVTGVDPAPFRTLLLPLYRTLPAALRLPLLAASTALSLPADLTFGPRLRQASWHKVFVVTRPDRCRQERDPR